MARKILILGLCLLCSGLMRAGAADLTGQAILPGKGVARDAVVYLEGNIPSAPMPGAMVDQRNQTFLPHVSVVTRGTTVNFPNDDSVFHNVFAYFQAKSLTWGCTRAEPAKKSL